MKEKTEQMVGDDIKETPTKPASGSDIESLISQSSEASPPEGMRVCRACLIPPDVEDTEFCGHCGAKLVTIRKAIDPYLGTIVGEKFTIISKIGQGGMGEVYLAVNDKIGQKVAIKFLSKRFADDENIVLRFLNEARSYCRVNHPNAVTLLEFGQHETGTLYIITEFVEGMSITDTLKANGPLSLEEALDVGIQVAEVLSAAHEQGVIHRDLKPDNIMLTPSKRGRYVVKVLDFGIAKIIDDDEGPATETGSVFGTPEFMSPEQARGDKVDPRADIYAFGIILFFLLTGKLPFKGENKLVVLNKQLHDAPPRLSEVRPDVSFSPAFESIILKCLEKKPKYRYQNADELLETLELFRVDDGAFLTSMHANSETIAKEKERDRAKKEILKLSTVKLGESGKKDEKELHTPFDDNVVTADLQSIEMWREAPETGFQETTSTRKWIIWFAILATVFAGLFILFSYFLGDENDTNLNEIFNEGQVLGVLSVAEQLLQDGKGKEALRAIEKAEAWEPLTDGIEKRIMDIRNSAVRAEAILKKLKKEPCDSHKEEIAKLKKISDRFSLRGKQIQKKFCAKSKKKIIEKAEKKTILTNDETKKPDVSKVIKKPITQKENQKTPKKNDNVKSEKKPTKKTNDKVSSKSGKKTTDSTKEKQVEEPKKKDDGLPPKQL